MSGAAWARPQRSRSSRRRTRTLSLTYELADGTGRCLTFEEVLTYRINNIIYQNVINAAILSTVSSTDRNEVNRLVTWTCHSDDGTRLASSERLANISQQIANGDLILAYFEPSWGAEVGVIARRVWVG